MPLKPGNSKETVSQNISGFHTGPTYAHTAAKYGKKRANAQAIAVALSTARKYRKAEGGGVYLGPMKKEDNWDDWSRIAGPELHRGDPEKYMKSADPSEEGAMDTDRGVLFIRKHPAKDEVPMSARGGKIRGYDDGGAAFGTGSPAEEMEKPNPLADYLRKIAGEAVTLPRRAIQNSQYSLDTGNYNPAPTVEAAMLPMGTGAVAGVPVKAGEAVLGAGPIRAYHGSPHDFDAFDLSKIGTGEGAQAYGHGLYFAEHEPVAKKYRDALAGTMIEGKPFNPDNPLHSAASLVGQAGSREGAIATIKQRIERDPGDDFYPRVLNLLQSNRELPRASPNPGKMYEVNINADPAHFLDWDKPLAQQPEVLSKLENAGVFTGRKNFDTWDALIGPNGTYVNPNDAAQRAYIAAQQAHGADAATNTFREAGIPGIKYLDQGSRRLNDVLSNFERELERAKTPEAKASIKDSMAQYAAQASRNYVVFNDKIIDILRKYGIAVPGAAGAAAMATQSERSPDRMKRGGKILDRALREAKKYASGGPLNESGLGDPANHISHPSGLINSSVPGRTDKLPINVKAGSYIVPSDTVSALGEGNTSAGTKVMDHMIASHAAKLGSHRAGKIAMPGMKRKIRLTTMRTTGMADGGEAGEVPIIAAGGEYVVHPDDVTAIGGGDLDKGHSVLDAFVKKTRRELRQKLGRLRPPKVD